MSPRPRATSDSDILSATYRIVSRLGPNLTLADIAKEAGISPATLVQRFGSKRGLLLALAASGSQGLPEEFARIRAAHRSPLAAIVGVGDCVASMAGSFVGLTLILSGRGSMKSALPFGTFLALGAAFAAVLGPGLLTWYLGQF